MRTGDLVWASQTPVIRGDESALYGGGIAYDNGRIFATNGLGYVAALSEQTGRDSLEGSPGGAARGSPTVANWSCLRRQRRQSDPFTQGRRWFDQLVRGRVA